MNWFTAIVIAIALLFWALGQWSTSNLLGFIAGAFIVRLVISGYGRWRRAREFDQGLKRAAQAWMERHS